MPICKGARGTAVLAALLTASGAQATRDARFAALVDYTQARAAFAEHDLDRAARGFDAALAADPGEASLQRRAFQMAVIAGDARRAEAIAAGLPSAPGQDAEVAVFDLARAFARSNWRAADTALDRVAALKLGGGLVPVARAWSRFGRGDRAGAVQMLDPAHAPADAGASVAEARAAILSAAGRWAEARDVYAMLIKAGSAGADTLLAAANASDRAGDRAGAAALLDKAGQGGAIEAARVRLAANKPVLTKVDGPREGAASIIGQLAAEFARSHEPLDGVVFARIASFAAPGDAAATLLLADILARAEQSAAALAVLDAMPPRSVWAGEARGLRAQVLAETGHEADAHAILESAAEARGALAYDWTLLGELNANNKRYAVAAEDYGHVLEIEGARAGWQAWFARGSAYEQAQDWTRGEPDLRHAVALAPKQPIALNYLGYSLIDRGVKIDEGTGLISRALALDPESAAILDSLGWAYFKTGRIKDALPLLERAVAGDAGDPTVNEHLGDAYWAVGRRIEARYRWNAAAASEPDAVGAKRIAAKIDYGYDRAALADATPAR